MMLGVMRVREVVPLSCHPEGTVSWILLKVAMLRRSRRNSRVLGSLRRRRFVRRGIVVPVGIRS